MFKKSGAGFYYFDEFFPPGLLHGFSTRQFGNMSFKYGSKEEVVSNRQKFAQAVGFKLQTQVEPHLVHGTKVAVASKPGSIEETDAAVTNRAGLALWIMTADCAPIIFFDPVKKDVGIAHSGWMGTVGKISLKVVGKMVSEFGSKPNDILVGIGPTIGKCCYKDNLDPFQRQLPEWQPFLQQLPDGKYSVDLNGFTRNELTDIGIKPDHIFDSNFCTMDHKDEFFCSQLETDKIESPARFASVISLI